MEIKIVNDKDRSFTIKEKEINGITGPSRDEVVEKLILKNKEKDTIIINGDEISRDEINFCKDKIVLVKEEMDEFYLPEKVYECMYWEVRNKRLNLKNPKKKVWDSLTVVGLDLEYLNRNVKDLSASEKKLLQIGMALMTNKEVIVLVEPFQFFDKKEQQQMFLFLQRIKENYNKTIVIVGKDENKMYQYTDHIIIAKNHKVLIEGKTKDVYKKVDYLKKHNVEVPEIVLFTYLAKKNKNAKIDYHKDIRDLIKDIYKHV